MLFSNGCTWATILLLNDAESDFRLSCLVHISVSESAKSGVVFLFMEGGRVG